MAFFGVTKEIIEQVKPHSNADKLELGKLKGLSFQFVIGKGQFNVGDEVLYFPVDSLIPENVLKLMGIEGKLSGANKNRIKTIKLRGEISQGIVTNINLLTQLGFTGESNSETITNFLGITKFEPPAIIEKNANLVVLPVGLSVYDIEGCDRFETVVNQLMNTEVAISEKIEGQNASITYDATTDKIFVNQRRFSILEIEGYEHSIWKTFREMGFVNNIKTIFNELKELLGNANQVTIYGEFCGPSVQSNIYKLNKFNIFCFDIKFGERFVDFTTFEKIMNKYNFTTAPILAKNIKLSEWLNGKTIQEASNGKSVLFDTLREGVVIKPMSEQYSYELSGRLILKQRSPEYLNKSEF